MALGSGSYDGIVGTGVYGRWRKGFFTASLQYAIRSEGDFDHQYANDLTWFGGPGIYLVLTHKYTLALQAVVSGETKGKDTFGGGARWRLRGNPCLPRSTDKFYLGQQVERAARCRLACEQGQLGNPSPSRLSYSSRPYVAVLIG